MKTNLLSLLLLAFTALQINAQCNVSGSFVANSPNTNTYPIQGNANITVELDGSVSSVNFEAGFASVQGFKLAVYLSETETIDTDPLTNPNPTTFIRVDQDGDLLDDEHNSATSGHDGHDMTGAKTFTQNLSGVNLGDYQYVILQCIQFHVPWGFAQLTNESPDCATLSTNENTLSQNISLFPNPATTQFEVRNELQTPVSVVIYDVLGKQVQSIQSSQLKNQPVSLSNLNSGVYLVEIKSDTQRIVKKLIKR